MVLFAQMILYSSSHVFIFKKVVIHIELVLDAIKIMDLGCFESLRFIIAIGTNVIKESREKKIMLYIFTY